MWDADERWLPHLIEGNQFAGTLRFDADGDTLLEADISVS